VLVLRGPLRRWLGAQRAYGVWLVVPLAGMGSLMPVDLAAGSTAGPIQATNDRVLAWLLAPTMPRPWPPSGSVAPLRELPWPPGVTTGSPRR